MLNGGAVELYHSNSKKFETVGYGVIVTGAITASNNINFGNKTIAELGVLQNSGNLKPGDIAMIEDANGTSFVAMFGTQGEWISAGDF